MKKGYIAPTSSTRLAQTLIMQELNEADESIQALLLELIVTKELRISNVKYNVPKPFFLVIAILPQGYNRLSISSQLVRYSFYRY
jgi:MoxR-like ATPase